MWKEGKKISTKQASYAQISVHALQMVHHSKADWWLYPEDGNNRLHIEAIIFYFSASSY